MNIFKLIVKALSSILNPVSDKATKELLTAKILSDMDTVPRQAFLQSIFDYYTQRHVLSVDLMQIINSVREEGNLKLRSDIDNIVKEFSYFPNSNTYCVPMIRLNLQSSSILLPAREFSSMAATVALEAIQIRRKIKRCVVAIKKHHVSQHLLDYVETLKIIS